MYDTADNLPKAPKFRFECGKGYVYDSTARAYLYCGNLNGRSQSQFKRDYEEQLYLDAMACDDME